MEERHPSWAEILDACERREGYPTALAEHLGGCSSCRELESGARRTLEGLAAMRVPAPPAELVARALALVFAEARADAGAVADPWASLRGLFRDGLRAVQARFVVDSLQPSHAFRGTATGVPRALLYETPDHSVSLSLQEGGAPGSWLVRGQLAPRVGDSLPSGGRAFLTGAETHIESTLSNFGEFGFAESIVGPLYLALEIGDQRVEVGPFGGLPESSSRG